MSSIVKDILHPKMSDKSDMTCVVIYVSRTMTFLEKLGRIDLSSYLMKVASIFSDESKLY